MIKRGLIVFPFLLALAGCGSTSQEPTLAASGYIADGGIVRLWSKVDGEGQPMRLMSVYTPFSGDTIATHYEFIDGKLSLIRSEAQNDALIPQTQLRLDPKGNPSFMQRRLADRNESLSEDDILRMKYESQRVLAMSRSLAAGKIRLHQGYIQDRDIISCGGEAENPRFSPSEQQWLDKRIRNGGFVSLAWLSSSRGIQLLLVANENFCQWEPKLSNF
ncbi:DUF1481 domain-containing protein [Leminorella grimontii]|uniref:DUF1481 domain-containing protein n=1 Tax=Leminorella grimontii TaxID=82981 RepID=UPI00321FFADE